MQNIHIVQKTLIVCYKHAQDLNQSQQTIFENVLREYQYYIECKKSNNPNLHQRFNWKQLVSFVFPNWTKSSQIKSQCDKKIHNDNNLTYK